MASEAAAKPNKAKVLPAPSHLNPTSNTVVATDTNQIASFTHSLKFMDSHCCLLRLHLLSLVYFRLDFSFSLCCFALWCATVHSHPRLHHNTDTSCSVSIPLLPRLDSTSPNSCRASHMRRNCRSCSNAVRRDCARRYLDTIARWLFAQPGALGFERQKHE